MCARLLPCVLLCWAGVAAPTAAQSTSVLSLDALRNHIEKKREELVVAQGQLAALKLELRLLERAQAASGRRKLELSELGQVFPDEVVEAIAKALQGSVDKRRAALAELIRNAERSQDKARQEWQAAVLTTNRVQAEADRVAFKRQTGATQRSFFAPRVYAALGLSAVILFLGYRLLQHERRVALRQSQRLARLLLFGALLGLAAPAWAVTLEDVERQRLQGEAGALDEQLKQVRIDIGTCERERTQLNPDGLLNAWDEFLKPLGAVKLPTEAEKILDEEKISLAWLHALLKLHATALAFANAAQAENERALRVRAEVTSNASADSWLQVAITAGRVVPLLLCALVPLALLLVYRRSVQQQRDLDYRTCPRCGRLDTLTLKAHKAICSGTRRNPEHCDYVFPSDYRAVSHLCFPTVGYVGSGKTRWLAVSYYLIRNKQVPDKLTLRTVPSEGEKQDAFEEALDLIVQGQDFRLGTQHKELPHPLNLHLLDKDNNKSLVNLFDFSGEMMWTTIDKDKLRDRALGMSGFLFFLDPTLTDLREIESQRSSLSEFYHDVRTKRKVAVGLPVPVPVAVCLSRLDMLPAEMDGWIEDLYATSDEPVTLELLQRRSKMCEEQLPVLFRTWDPHEELRQDFGKNILYFPVSSVGIDPAGRGMRSVGEHHLNPFGVLEPLLWLLHMHGYEVLRERA